MRLTTLALEDCARAARLHQEAFYRGWTEQDFQNFLQDPLVFGLKIQLFQSDSSIPQDPSSLRALHKAERSNPVKNRHCKELCSEAIQGQQTNPLQTFFKLTTGLLRSALCRARNDGSHLFDGFILWREVEDETEILTLVVAPTFQSKGLGNLLLQTLFKKLQGKGISKVFLEVAEDNEKARSFYGKFGFKTIGKRPLYYERPGNIFVDGLNLCKIIWE